MTLFFLLLFIVPVIGYGIYEQREHQKRIDSIPIRVNVNGIRGKSTATRLITGILKEAGYKTIGKTTGTSARMIYSFEEEEEPITRRPEGPNIGEQRMVVKKSADHEVEALVCECMAVNPDYQIVFQNKLLQANIGVIVNVLEDHMDVMGPTLNEIAEAFTATIPYNGHLITINGPYLEFFKKVAEERQTKVIVADNSKISEEFLSEFSYVVFPDNASIALAVAEALEIPEDIAFKGMLNSNPDPGALRVTTFGNKDTPSYFVNGFAANDSASTLKIWETVTEGNYNTRTSIIIMNCRADRLDRTEQFATDVLPYIEADILMLVGEATQEIVEAYNESKLPVTELWDMEGKGLEEILNQLEPKLTNTLIYGIGNIKGAEDLIDTLSTYPQLEKTS